MFSNHLRMAFRQLFKSKGYAVLNIFGLAIGIAAALLIWRMLRYELSYNHVFAHHERIGRIYMRTFGDPAGDRPFRGVTVPAMIEFQAKIKDIAASSRTREDWPTLTVANPNGGAPVKKVSSGEEEIGLFVEPDFFRIFDLKWLAGGVDNSFAEAGSTVVNRSTAEKLFGSVEAAPGRTLFLDNRIPSVVRGVYEDLPKNCDLPVYALTSFATLRANKQLYGFTEDNWGSNSSNDELFFLLQDKSQFASLAPAVAEIGKSQFEEAGRRRNMTVRLEMQPLDAVHFDEDLGSSSKPAVSHARLWTLGAIGLLVLAMACFNFINLATAVAISRAREVGVRKAIGGQKSTLMMQFLTETGMVTLFSILLGSLVAKAAAPLLKAVSEVPDNAPFFSDPLLWVFLAITGAAVALLSGLWPAFLLSGLSPVRALKNSVFAGGERGFTLRKGLIVAQFAIAQALLAGAVITMSQMDFLKNMDIGVSKDLIVNAGFTSDSASLTKLDFLKAELLRIPTVEAVSFSTDEPTSGSTWANNFAFGRGDDEVFSTTVKYTDADYPKTYGLKMVVGRWFEPSDTAREYVVNESMLKKVGVATPEEAIGQEIRLGGGTFWRVCGVVRDFQTKSAHARSRRNEPLLLAPRREFYSHLSVKIRPKGIPQTQEAIGKAYDAAFPEQVYDPRFFDENLARFYQKEAQFSAFARGIAFLAVLIGCLGLFGLASHTAAKRTKEIGIRKALGASVSGIMALLTKDFLQLVLIAIVVASPPAYYFMQYWLSDFAYRINPEWWMFAGAGAAALVIAFLTVSVQSVRAALTNPVNALRSE